MNQQGNILVNQSVPNDPESVFRVVAPFGKNISAAIETSTGVAEFAEELIRLIGPSRSLIPVMLPE